MLKSFRDSTARRSPSMRLNIKPPLGREFPSRDWIFFCLALPFAVPMEFGLGRKTWFAFINNSRGQNSFALPNIPAGNYDLIRFHIGLEPAVNHSDSAQYPAGHPLNPELKPFALGLVGRLHLPRTGRRLAGRRQAKRILLSSRETIHN
ncbi:MAG: hypothetical protein WDN00_16460 [Limisphaerales bacterium]